MNILIVGSGARELAIARAYQRSSQFVDLFFILSHAHPDLMLIAKQFVIGDICHVNVVIHHAQQWQIDMAIIGPEAPLEKGLVDSLWQCNIPTMGPTRSLARIETSKSFTRYLMQKYHISGLPFFQSFNSTHSLMEVKACLKNLSQGYVIKMDGLAGGKGVKISDVHLKNLSEAYQFCEHLMKNQQSFLIEEKCLGEEFSLMGFCDGETIHFMPLVQDYKRVGIHDTGVNTGGMGSISFPNHTLPFISEKDLNDAKKIFHEVLFALQKECGEKYCGILYGGFMATEKGMAVIEFNARFGDPESINVLSLLKSDFVEISNKIIHGDLKNMTVEFSHQATVCKYLVPEGYPEKHQPTEIKFSLSDFSMIYRAGVSVVNDQFISMGSRAIAVLGMANTLQEAESLVEKQIQLIQGKLFYRKDIGSESLLLKRIQNMKKLREKMI